ncbi:hypothetical protein WSM22_33260 [Cytophagales bacterium WSM2-2]|nr:hypothetical protein WSM22_33260 [Cytophagales bacterium WSM2-2]
MEGIHFLPHGPFTRIGIGRIKIRIELLRKVFSIKPDILIVCTHELLGVALLYRVFTGKKVVYDIQENYRKNIIYTEVFPFPLRHLVGSLVRFREWIVSFAFSKFILAERCYESELPFARARSVVIENKCRVPADFRRKPASNITRLIFTGTIAESTGVFQAIELTKKLHKADPKIQLLIMGYCAQSSVFKKLEKEIAMHPFITMFGGEAFLSHEVIMDGIASAHFGFICYPMSPHIENKIPSKLYEYLACQLPILVQDHAPWVKLCLPPAAAVKVNFDEPNVPFILEQINKEGNFYTRPASEARWESEETRFIEAIQSI